jgi:hypothetical protein
MGHISHVISSSIEGWAEAALLVALESESIVVERHPDRDAHLRPEEAGLGPAAPHIVGARHQDAEGPAMTSLRPADEKWGAA